MNKIEELKKRLPSIKSSVQGLRKESTKSLCGPCPKCGGDDRFYTRTDKDFFECRQCGAKGDVIDFHVLINSMNQLKKCMGIKLEKLIKIKSKKPYLKIKKHNKKIQRTQKDAPRQNHSEEGNMKKKKLIIIVLTVVLSLSIIGIALGSDFCDGFRHGYITGYKQASGSSFDPFVPFCPFKPFKGFSDPKSDYELGYTIGYRQGMRDGSR